MEYHAGMMTLKALRGFLRPERPEHPKQLEKGQALAEGVIRHCIDSRKDEKADLNLSKGEYFLATSAGAVVPPWNGGKGAESQTVVDLGYPVTHGKHVKTIIIMGHTYCGANKELLNALLSDKPIPNTFETHWMGPMASSELKQTLSNAKKQGTSEAALARMVERATVLQSIRNLYDYYFNDVSVRESVDKGQLHIIGAIRDLSKGNDHRQTLYVYDAERERFRDIRDVHKELGAPPLATLRAYQPPLADSALANRNIESLSHSMRLMLSRVESMEKQQQRIT